MISNCAHETSIFIPKSITSFITSDGTLNPSGVRFGSAEIYNAGEHFSLIFCSFNHFFIHSFIHSFVNSLNSLSQSSNHLLFMY